MRILICGYGNIGRHLENEFKRLCGEISIYDKYKSQEVTNWCGSLVGDNALSMFYDYAFVAVPTEMLSDGSCDTSEVEWIVDRLTADVIIIKSAVPVTICGKLKETGKHIVISPEYYGTTQHSLESPNFVVFGGEKEACHKAARLYSRVKDGSFRYIYTTIETAALAKYMENCWIATKVTFCNEFAKIAKHFNVAYEELRECFIADERVSPSHTYVYPDKPYYDSHCLNKDIPALIQQCCTSGMEVPFMQSVNLINIKSKKE